MGFSGKFKGITDAKVFKGGQYFKEGLYKVKILAVKWVESARDKSEYFVIETEVLESSNPEIAVGSERSQVIDYGQTMGLPNIKAFVAAASGIDPYASDNLNDEVVDFWSKLTGQHIDFEDIVEMLIKENPLEGEVMDLECTEIITKEKKQPFTKHSWFARDTSNDEVVT